MSVDNNMDFIIKAGFIRNAVTFLSPCPDEPLPLNSHPADSEQREIHNINLHTVTQPHVMEARAASEAMLTAQGRHSHTGLWLTLKSWMRSF